MTKQQVFDEIRALLTGAFADDAECCDLSAEKVFEQIPIASCEVSGEYSFSDLVRFAAHDVHREHSVAL